MKNHALCCLVLVSLDIWDYSNGYNHDESATYYSTHLYETTNDRIHDIYKTYMIIRKEAAAVSTFFILPLEPNFNPSMMSTL